jgi:hypothetical protein
VPQEVQEVQLEREAQEVPQGVAVHQEHQQQVSLLVASPVTHLVVVTSLHIGILKLQENLTVLETVQIQEA